ncbi:hypothetical protein [Neoroseomonas soli]|uniref:Uncharacterized protein n=1 Tax=Neoroseomonas soli TaxID=1081025 RepID=A0A9X9X1F1_9PROT|nr:hypothetical protein [Neoroseomonas soli]MBR0673230.1 hypothetical protein [Neoroseomonas soli]
MILLRILQVVGVAGILACAHLAWQATPWGGEGWARARLLYAGAGAIPALALLGIASLCAALRRQAQEIAALKDTLARIEKRLGA